MRVCVIGTGYVGLVTGPCLADLGHHVACIDKDETKIKNLKNNIIPIYESGLKELIDKCNKSERISFSTSLKDGMKDADVVMMLRLQKERMDGGFIPSEREYYHRFGLDAKKLRHAKPDAIVMHPGPMNRGVEIDSTIADDINRSVIQEQVEMGVAVRMAAMNLLARNLHASREDTGVMV